MASLPSPALGRLRYSAVHRCFMGGAPVVVAESGSGRHGTGPVGCWGRRQRDLSYRFPGVNDRLTSSPLSGSPDLWVSRFLEWSVYCVLTCHQEPYDKSLNVNNRRG